MNQRESFIRFRNIKINNALIPHQMAILESCAKELKTYTNLMSMMDTSKLTLCLKQLTSSGMLEDVMETVRIKSGHGGGHLLSKTPKVRHKTLYRTTFNGFVALTYWRELLKLFNIQIINTEATK